MSDLLLPFLLLMDDDALAFWCFVSLMQRMGARHNFAVDERGIFGQLRLLGQVRTAQHGTAQHNTAAQHGTAMQGILRCIDTGGVAQWLS